MLTSSFTPGANNGSAEVIIAYYVLLHLTYTYTYSLTLLHMIYFHIFPTICHYLSMSISMTKFDDTHGRFASKPRMATLGATAAAEAAAQAALSAAWQSSSGSLVMSSRAWLGLGKLGSWAKNVETCRNMTKIMFIYKCISLSCNSDLS